jgi:hypothetical protein
MENITINNCFEIIEKSIEKKYCIECYDFSMDRYMFSIKRGDERIEIRIDPDSIFISYTNYQNDNANLEKYWREVNYNITSEERRHIEFLYLKIDELKEELATERFLNFI